MGSGQSKFYRNANRQQYPFGPPPPMYPGQYNQQPFVPQFAPMGYGSQMYPQQQMQGFIPPGVYGQGSQLPPPMLNWLPQDRRKSRKSRRRESERFVGGFGPSQQSEAPRRSRSTSHRREDPVVPPVIPRMQMPVPSNGASESARRAPTPFIPSSYARDDEEEDRPRSHSRHNHNRRPSRESDRYSPPHSINGDFAHVMQPLEPANPSAFGPTGPRSNAPLRNPLPPPPRDIYEMSPYKTLLTMPQTSALLTASYGPHLATVSTNPQPAKVERKRSVGRSLLRAFSKREKKPDAQPQVHFVPVFVPADQNKSQTSTHPVAQTYDTATAQQAADLIRSMSQQRRPGPTSTPMQATAPTPRPAMRPYPTPGFPSVAPSTHSADAMFPPVPPNPSSPPAVRFDQDSPYAVFMNHSPHRVIYLGAVYPTAAHLFEAFKFIDQHPEIAENIRACPDVHGLYDLTNRYSSSIRPDWGYVHLGYMDEVLFLKFKQHADLRLRLLGTGDARIIYADQNDTFWGTGPDESGQNLLGKALVRVRDKLRMENLSAET